MVRCGIIGAGSIGRQHVRELKAAGAGVSFDLGSHAFYRAWYAMGKPKPVSATAALYSSAAKKAIGTGGGCRAGTRCCPMAT